MTKPGRAIRGYREHIRSIRRLYRNPLKRSENLAVKDRLEREFFDKEADKFLRAFDEHKFTYDPDESMPRSHVFLYSLFDDIAGKKILDCCCGHGIATVRLAKKGALVSGLDISPKMLELAGRNVSLNNVSDRVDLHLMSVQEMAFPANTFDYAVGLGALHHLNLESAGREISRVLKPGGRAVFLEPRVPFRWLMTARSLFPAACYESPGGGGLTDADVEYFASHFSTASVDYFFFLRKLARFRCLARFADTFDRWDTRLISAVPMMKKLYWAFVLQYIK